jgi:predicted nucleotidyltransferase
MMDAALHTLASGERAILARLRCMTEVDFEALPFGSGGLWRKFMHAVKEQTSLEQIIEATKSKRYTRTRIDRMVMCAFLGLTRQDLAMDIPYCRILAFNDTGRQVLSKCKKDGFFVNVGQNTRHPWQDTEDRMDDLYGLFCQDGPEKPGKNRERRVYYHQ